VILRSLRIFQGVEVSDPVPVVTTLGKVEQPAASGVAVVTTTGKAEQPAASGVAVVTTLGQT
jgi:hypothetical protein